MSIKKTLEDFDKDFPKCDCRNNLPPHFEDSKVNRDWIKQFITSEIEKALNEIVPPRRRFKPEDESQREMKHGWNECREVLKSNISNYIK